MVLFCGKQKTDFTPEEFVCWASLKWRWLTFKNVISQETGAFPCAVFGLLRAMFCNHFEGVTILIFSAWSFVFVCKSFSLQRHLCSPLLYDAYSRFVVLYVIATSALPLHVNTFCWKTCFIQTPEFCFDSALVPKGKNCVCVLSVISYEAVMLAVYCSTQLKLVASSQRTCWKTTMLITMFVSSNFLNGNSCCFLCLVNWMSCFCMVQLKACEDVI